MLAKELAREEKEPRFPGVIKLVLFAAEFSSIASKGDTLCWFLVVYTMLFLFEVKEA